jgi:hypothetical protein
MCVGIDGLSMVAYPIQISAEIQIAGRVNGIGARLILLQPNKSKLGRVARIVITTDSADLMDIGVWSAVSCMRRNDNASYI